MDKTKWPAIAGLVGSAVVLSRTVPTTFALDKPIHTSIAIYVSLGASIMTQCRRISMNGRQSHHEHGHESLALEGTRWPHDSPQTSPVRQEDVRYPSSLRKLRILFLALVFALCLRAEVLREILAHPQCAIISPQILLPFSLVLWDFWTVHRHERRSVHDDPGGNIYDAVEQYVTRSPYRYPTAVLVASLGGTIAVASTRAPRSTVICPASLHYRWSVPILQWLASTLDTTIVYCIGQLLHQQEGRGPRSLTLRFMSIAWAFLFSAVILFSSSVVYFYITPVDRSWILTIPSLYLQSTAKLLLILCFAGLCALHSVYHIGTTTTALIATFVSVSTSTTGYAWSNSHPFPPTLSSIGFAAFCFAILGFASYFHFESVWEGTRPVNAPSITFEKVPSWFYLFLLSLFFVRTGLWASQKASVSYHPIDMLIYEAQTNHEAYVNQTLSSIDLPAAVRNYQQQYNRHPPPAFDQWYQYATARNSIVINEYHSIHKDLLPFYAQQPAEIRQATWQMISNPWNDAAGISVRSGQVVISPNVVPTHRWMLDGLVEMIGHFAEHLPDMDLAFNLNDEPRIVVPHDRIEQMRETGKPTGGLAVNPRNSFSKSRAEQWQPIPDPPNSETPLHELSFEKIFENFGSIGCPTNSASRTQRIWNTQKLCTQCAAPQSLGAFLANWTVAADICHQPDLANLHGLYLAPAAFKGTHDLYPIFSQSKVHGFSDILYPSAWNYINKAQYEPSDAYPDLSFTEKNNTIFWRGATTEGVSHGMGQWMGMTRQRILHMSRDINNSAPSQTLLLPSDKSDTYTYVDFSTADLARMLSTDIFIAKRYEDLFARCGGRDCNDQEVEFSPLVEPADFQAHWQYKYLLDLDGAGFSGRFLPFLRSRSLPFKAALFREWWDERVTPWQHFVPLDLRGQGFWATLAYFAGIDYNLRGKRIKVEAHEVEAERIATRGRNWANKVLRREDMEIYMFRLLLEWGRLTDDERDSIGFSLE